MTTVGLDCIPSVCATIIGPPYPKRGIAAGVLELIAALFLPTCLRIVVGGIGVLRILFGTWRWFKEEEVAA